MNCRKKIEYEKVKAVCGEDRVELALLSNQVFSMSETAAFIYAHAGEVSCEEDMARLLTKEYEVDMDTAREDTKEVLAFLKRAGILAD